METWFAEAQAFVEKQDKTRRPAMDDFSYFVVWLPQRIKQMEKVLPQL